MHAKRAAATVRALLPLLQEDQRGPIEAALKAATNGRAIDAVLSRAQSMIAVARRDAAEAEDGVEESPPAEKKLEVVDDWDKPPAPAPSQPEAAPVSDTVPLPEPDVATSEPAANDEDMGPPIAELPNVGAVESTLAYYLNREPVDQDKVADCWHRLIDMMPPDYLGTLPKRIKESGLGDRVRGDLRAAYTARKAQLDGAAA